MVVSEMGEQWSPQTAPAMQAEMHTTDKGLSMGKHTLHNGNEHPKGSLAGPCGKSQQAANEEHNSRQEHLDLGGVAVNKVPDKILRAQRIRHRFSAFRQN